MKTIHAAAFVLGLLGACRTASSPPQKSPTTQTYAVEGQVKHAGVRPFEEDLTLFEAISAAEPLEKTCDLEHVHVTRTGAGAPLEFVLDVAVMLKTGDSTNNILIQPGDVILVPARAGS